nr:chemosensory protein 8 [Daktulosphaira vitifoliae]
MNPLFVFSSILIVVCTTSVRSKSPVSPFTAASGKYVSSYDHLDVGHLLKNDKLVTAYIKCFMDEGPCTKEGKQVKNTLLPDIISTVCSKCSQKQRNMARQVLTNIYQKRRSDFERIMEKYDADDKYDEIITFMNESEPETES